MKQFSLVFRVVLVALGVGACGDSGDSPFFSGLAVVDVSTTPGVIDVGEETFVEVEVDNLDVDRHPSFFLKVRYPSGLSYVDGSGAIVVNGENSPRAPDRLFLLGGDEYAVFFLSSADFGTEDDFMVLLKLRGDARVTNGIVEADPDVDDRNIPNDQEFDESNPEFNAEEGASIEVLG